MIARSQFTVVLHLGTTILRFRIFEKTACSRCISKIHGSEKGLVYTEHGQSEVVNPLLYPLIEVG